MLSGRHNKKMAESIFIFALVLLPFFVLGNIIDPTCQPVGTKSVTISWKFSLAQAGKSPHAFKVYFCKNPDTNVCSNTSINYHLGCAVNFTGSKSEYSCDIGKALALDFPRQHLFNYYVQEDSGLLVKVWRCPVNINIQCSKPTGLKVRPSGKRTLLITWPPPTDMGNYRELLCYYITYYDEESPDKKFHQEYRNEGVFKYEIKYLLPYKKYYVLLQCALNCEQKKSLPAGPASATTLEEEPQDMVSFQDWINHPANDYTRNVTVLFKIPDKAKWNGPVRKIRVFCYKYDHLCTNITLEIIAPHGNWRYNVTFPFLRKDTTYYIKADYCNSVGCSPNPKRNLTVLPFQTDAATNESEAKLNESLSTGVVVGIAVGGVVVLLFLITAAMLIKKYCWSSRHHENLRQRVGSLSSGHSELQHEGEGGEQTDEVYSKADGPVQRKATLNPETTDFQSASVRSLNSSNSIGGLADQSEIRNGEKGRNEESVRLLQRSGSPSFQHKPSLEDNSLLPTRVECEKV